MLMRVKEAVIRLKNRSKPIGEIEETSGVDEGTIWHIFRKSECTGQLRNTRRPGKPQKMSKNDDGRKWNWATEVYL